MKKILVLEDEVSIREFIVINLKRAGYEVIEAGTGAEAFEQLRDHPDIRVAILDIMLPDTDGFEVCRKIRTSDPFLGIVMLSARAQEMDKVTGLMAGADDYVTKPISSVAEFMLRIEAIFRRVGTAGPVDSGELVHGPFRLNTKNRKLEKDGVRITLTPTEFWLMKMFMDHPGEALSREDILNIVWERDHFGDPKTVDVNITRLRKKIEDDPTKPEYIITERSHGYMWSLNTNGK